MSDAETWRMFHDAAQKATGAYLASAVGDQPRRRLCIPRSRGAILARGSSSARLWLATRHALANRVDQHDGPDAREEAAGVAREEVISLLRHARFQESLRLMEAASSIAEHFEFDAELHRHGLAPLTRVLPRTLQINVGTVCNQACHHCHVDAGP